MLTVQYVHLIIIKKVCVRSGVIYTHTHTQYIYIYTYTRNDIQIHFSFPKNATDPFISHGDESKPINN